MKRAIAALLLAGLAVFATPAATQAQCVDEKINYYGTVYSKTYATIRTPDGRCLSVPVINGYLPSIDEVTEGGITTRTYSYISGVKHVPGTIPNYKDRCGSSSSTYKLPAPRVTESRSFRDDDDDYDRYKKKPYTAPAPSSSVSYYNRPAPRVSESVTYDYPKGASSYYGGSSYNKEIEEAKKEIREIKELLKKMEERGKEEKKAPVTAPAPSSSAKEIAELKEEVQKLKALTLKYEEALKKSEKKEPLTLPAPSSGMVQPSKLGTPKKD